MHSQAIPLLSLLVVSSLLFTTEAAECTDAEATTAESIWAAAATTSACAPYVTQTDPVFVNAPCTATDCVAVVEGVAKELPDCTFSGINNKIEVQNALTACNGGETADAGSLTVATDAPQATTATDSSTTASSASTLSSASASSSSDLIPTSTTSSTSCTTSEIRKLWKSYVAAATSDECSSESVVNEENIQILADCDSKCIDTVRDLADELPNCFYDYEYINKKQVVLDALNGCDGSASSVALTLIPDTAVNFSSSAGSEVSAPEMPSSSSSSSGSVVAGSSDVSGSNQLRSGDDPSDETLDSSTGGSGSNASPLRTSELHLGVSLLIGMIVLFMS